MQQIYPSMEIRATSFFMVSMTIIVTCLCLYSVVIFHLQQKLRPSNIDACKGTEEILERLVNKIRSWIPEVKIISRGDSGFCCDSILNVCESLKIQYVIGMAKNDRLLNKITRQTIEASRVYHEAKEPARVFTRFSYRTKKLEL